MFYLLNLSIPAQPLTDAEINKYTLQLVNCATTIKYIQFQLQTPGPDSLSKEYFTGLNDSLNSFYSNLKLFAAAIHGRDVPDGFISIVEYMNYTIDTVTMLYKNRVNDFKKITQSDVILTLTGCIADPFKCLVDALMHPKK